MLSKPHIQLFLEILAHGFLIDLDLPDPSIQAEISAFFLPYFLGSKV